MKSLISGFSAEFFGLQFSDKFQMKSRADAVGDFGEAFLDSHIRDLMHRKRGQPTSSKQGHIENCRSDF
jgi:hypothetical protein